MFRLSSAWLFFSILSLGLWTVLAYADRVTPRDTVTSHVKIRQAPDGDSAQLGILQPRTLHPIRVDSKGTTLQLSVPGRRPMKITSLRIQNLHLFADATIPMNDYTCLVGPNGSGYNAI